MTLVKDSTRWTFSISNHRPMWMGVEDGLMMMMMMKSRVVLGGVERV